MKKFSAISMVSLIILSYLQFFSGILINTVSANEAVKNDIINSSDLKVAVSYQEEGDILKWNVDYDYTGSAANEKSLFKVNLGDASVIEGNTITLNNAVTGGNESLTKSSDNWFKESSYQNRNKGTFKFTTAKTTNKINVKVQVDKQVTTEKPKSFSETLKSSEESESSDEDPDPATSQTETVTEEKKDVLPSQTAGPHAVEAKVTEDKPKEDQSAEEENSDSNANTNLEEETSDESDKDSKVTDEKTDDTDVEKDSDAEKKDDGEEKSTEKDKTDQAAESENVKAKNVVGNFSVRASAVERVVASYTNIAPVYTTDNSGTYPTNSWTPTGNNTVINHQGNKNATNQWDGNTNWNGDPTNSSNSYIEYGGTGEDADFAIRKYAKETNTPGLYDVYLNVRGNKQQDIKPIDIVLVVDMSGSMNANENGGNDRVGTVRNGVREFFKTIQEAGIGDYVNVGFVGYSSPGYISNDGTISVGIGKASDTNHTGAILNGKHLGHEFKGGTFTQLGIRKGAEMLQNDTSGNQKMMILLTDGVPTFSYRVTSATTIDEVVYGTGFHNSDQDQPGNTSQLKNAYNSWGRWGGYRSGQDPNADSSVARGKGLYYSVGNIRIWNTWAATLGEAKIAKDNGIEINTLGIQLDVDRKNSDSPIYLNKDSVRSRASLIASSGLYQDAEQAKDIEDYLVEKAKNVVSSFNTIVNGSISDPLGSQFKYASSSVDAKSVGTTPVTDVPAAQMSNGKIDVSGLTLGEGQEVQYHYQVRLNTETSDFVPEKWYQMNGKTTLTPNEANPDNKVDFGVPSAKGEGVELTFKKLWNEYDSDASQRPESVTYEVSRNDTTIDGAWSKGYIKVEGTQDQNEWSKTTDKLASNANSANGDLSLWLPKYNTQGQAFKYKITNEIAVDGYDSNKIDDTTYENTKQFKPVKLEVLKEDGNGNKVAGAQFNLVDGKGEEIGSTVDSEGSTFTFENLIPGTYTLTEVKAPEGYVLLEDPIVIVINDNGTVTVDDEKVEIENNTIKLKVDNQQKGLLPSTGGNGRTGYWIAGAIVVLLFSMIAGIYFFRNYKNSPHKKGHHSKATKVVKSLVVLLTLLPVGIGVMNPVTAHARSEPSGPLTFVLHKRVFRNGQDYGVGVTGGLELDQSTATDEQSKSLINEEETYGLNGVTFAVYDATGYVSDKLKDMSQEELLKHVTDSSKETLLKELKPYNSFIEDVVTANDGDEDGVGKVTVNPTKENSAYLFIETKVSDEDADRIKVTATPMLIILPVENPTEKGTYLSTIHLYPKNTEIKPDEPTPPKPPEPEEPQKPEPPKPTPPGRLPQTGEAKSIMTFIGVFLVLGAVVLWMRRVRK